jgi:glycogen(starch) synthase
MRVLLTTDTIGGVWTYTREITEGLLQRSHSVALFSFGRLPDAAQSAWCADVASRFPGLFAYTPTKIPLEWMDENSTSYSGAEALLLDHVQSFRPDLLHFNQFCFGALPVSLPKLVVAHSDVLSWAAACRPQGLDPSPWLTQYKSLVQAGLDGTDAVVAPTHWMLQALADRFRLPRETYVIANGRDLPAVSTQPIRELQAVTIGRLWDEAKGLALLAEISSPLPIYVAGESQHASQSAPTSLGDAHLLGHLSEASLLHLLHSSSIYLALSKYEPFGLAPLEAALCGCAIVARDIPSFREVWGSAALYFQDASSLEHLLERLHSNPDLLAQSQGRSMERARQMTRSQMTELYLDLYLHLVEPEAHTCQFSADEVRSLVS